MAFTDDFNRSGALGADWTQVGVGTAATCNGASVDFNASSSSGVGHQCPDQGSADHYAYADLLNANAHSAVVVGYVDNNNYRCRLRHFSGAVKAYKRVSGTATEIGSWTRTFAAGEQYRADISGNDITVTIAGVAQTPVLTVTEHSTATRCGFLSKFNTALAAIDNFGAGTTAGEAAEATTPASLRSVLQAVLRSVLC